MLANIFWGVASLYTECFEKFIAEENKDNTFKKFYFFVNEKTFFIRSNFNEKKSILKYHYAMDELEHHYSSKSIFPVIEIVNTINSISFYTDTFGICSLYWTQKDNMLFFSNSSFFLAKLLGKAPLGLNGLFVHLILRGQVNYSSYYEDIFQLPSQNVLKYDYSKISITKRILNIPANLNLKEHLSDGIFFDGSADFGISFSGGIDSSILVQEFASKYENVSCYSLINMKNTNLKTDLYFAELLAKEIKMSLRKVPFKLYENIFYYDTPIMDHDVYGQYCLAKCMIQDGKKIMISGTGADELFGGYDQIFYYTHHLKNKNYDDQIYLILQRYSYTDFKLLKNIQNELFENVYNSIKLYYLDIVRQGDNLVSQLHYWFIYHHLFWILKMQPQNIKCIYPFLKEEFLSYCLQTNYKIIFPYVAYNQIDPSYHLKVKSIIKEQYTDILPTEILNRPKLPFSVQETEIDRWYEIQYNKNKPDYLIPDNIFSEIMEGKYGNQTKLLFLSYILWRKRVS